MSGQTNSGFEMSEKSGDASAAEPVDQKKSSSANDGKMQLERKMGLVGGVAMIAGTMIGSGIFISPAGVLSGSGSVGTSLIIWLGCGLLSLVGALCYIELGCVVPKSGGDYAYLLEGFSPLHRFFGPIPAFLFSYTRVFVVGPAMLAVVALSFGTYATVPFYPDGSAVTETALNDTLDLSTWSSTSVAFVEMENSGPPDWLPKLVAAGCVFVITVINCLSVELATRTQTFFTVIKVLALGVIIVGGFVKLGQGNTQQLATGFTPFDEITAAKVALSFYSGLWSYDGWNQLNLAVEEIKNPYRNLPRAIWIALPLVIILYIMTNISYLTVMTASEILDEDAVAAEFGVRVLGVMFWLMPLSVACSTFGAANGTAFGNSRIVLVAAREGHLVDVLSFVSIRFLTPLPAVLIQSIIAMAMIAAGDIGVLIDVFSFAAWIFYGLTFASLLILRRTRPNITRSYKVPLIFPIFMLLAAVGLVLLPVILAPQLAYLYVSLFILSGLAFYVPLVYYRKAPNCMSGFTVLVQRVFGLAPSKLDPDYDLERKDVEVQQSPAKM